ncbi:CHASE3 domain-containing protein [Tenacibaculum sp. ZS6-P6]|uniref:CHASE3 domain-containing protein n=1 Tax=Tenacibaculum sp. ZS6-P6 TaxID=3447503 RepID=UPI003F993C66
MKRDIRELFKEDELEKELPENHRIEFLEKLKVTNEKRKFPFKKIIGFVASLVVLISVYLFLPKNKIDEKNQQLLLHVQQIETEYLKNINTEWNNFLELTNDEKLIEKYDEKLKELSADYKVLSSKLNENPNDINVLEALISNLQKRLQTLKDIQEHIKSLKQKKVTYETIVI